MAIFLLVWSKKSKKDATHLLNFKKLFWLNKVKVYRIGQGGVKKVHFELKIQY